MSNLTANAIGSFFDLRFTFMPTTKVKRDRLVSFYFGTRERT